MHISLYFLLRELPHFMLIEPNPCPHKRSIYLHKLHSSLLLLLNYCYQLYLLPIRVLPIQWWLRFQLLSGQQYIIFLL